MDERRPVSQHHRRFESSSTQSPRMATDAQLSPRQANHFLPRSKSDMNMAMLSHVPSSSDLSYTPPSSRAESFSIGQDEKHTGMKSLIARSSRLLQKRRSSNRLRSFDFNSEESFHDGTNRRRLRSSKVPSPSLGLWLLASSQAEI